MIVHNIGYMNKDKVLELVLWKANFAIYRTNKNTQVLVIDPCEQLPHLYTHDKGRTEWKIAEDKLIVRCIEKLFDQDCDPSKLDTTGWNNGNQIIVYEFPHYLLNY